MGNEMGVVDRIGQLWPADAWQDHVAPMRLEQAQALADERRRRGQTCELLDCLQLSDKAMRLLADADERGRPGFRSRGNAAQAVKDIEALRDNLAHGQDVVGTDRAVIARFAVQLEEILALLARRAEPQAGGQPMLSAPGSTPVGRASGAGAASRGAAARSGARPGLLSLRLTGRPEPARTVARDRPAPGRRRPPPAEET